MSFRLLPTYLCFYYFFIFFVSASTSMSAIGWVVSLIFLNSVLAVLVSLL